MKKAIFTLACVGLIVLLTPGIGNAAVSAANTVAAWTLDEGAGDTLTDISGKGNNAKILGGAATWKDGKFGKAAELTDGIRIMSDTSNGVSPKFISECLWVNFTDTATEAQFGYINASGAASGRFFYFSTWCAAGPPHDCVHMGTLNLAGAWGRGIVTPKQFDTNQWYHVCGSINNETGTYDAYVNGTQVHTQVFDVGDSPGTPTSLSVGISPEDYPILRGLVDDVAFFNVALTQADVTGLMNNGVASTIGVTTAVDAQGKLATTWSSIKAR